VVQVGAQALLLGGLSVDAVGRVGVTLMRGYLLGL